MSSPERLILVDGSSLVYRAYFAIPANFSTADGLPTNAVYGFATMFRKMLAGRRPERGAVVFDPPGPSFRAARYPQYKAQRPPMPEDLSVQLPWIDRLVEAHHFPRLRIDGFEADDVIGTLTRLAVDRGMEVFIVSGDKDFAQLISDQVKMVDTLRDVTYDPELVRKKWGVLPEQFADLLALMGDKSDNIPGVPGIGQKGGAGLLATYGSLDGILEHTAELKGRQKKSLETYREQALLSRELATLDRRVPLPLELDDLKLELPEPAALNDLYRRLEFHSLLAQGEAPPPENDTEADYAALTTLEELDAFLAALPATAPVAVYPLFDGFSPAHGPLAGIAVSARPQRARWVPLFGRDGHGGGGLERLRPWLEDPRRPKITYNAKQLWMSFARLGVNLDGIRGDVLLESFLVEPTKITPHRLGQVVKEYLRRTLPPAKQVQGSGRKLKLFNRLERDALTPWACQRAAAIAEVWPVLRRRLEEEGHRSYLEQVELPLAWVLGQMELDGIAVDPADLARMSAEFADRLAGFEKRIFEHAGRAFNVGSPKQLSEVLFEDLGLPVIKRTKSGYSTDAEVLERLAPKHEIVNLVLEHRKLAKLINTYTEVLRHAVHPETGRIHASFQQAVSATGRLITTEPDLQRTPIKTAEGRRIRRAFVPRPGWKLISADWSQIELRLLAHFTGDALLVEAFEKGLDVHRRTAGQIFDRDPDAVSDAERGIGKLVNFATIYGQGASALAQTVGVSRKEAQRYIDDYFKAYRGVRRWLDETMSAAHESGWVETLLGRRRYIPELKSHNFMTRQAGERMAANTPIQGSAADLCKLAMLAVARRLASERRQTRMLLQIHDELVFEAPADEVDPVSELVRHEMENAYPLAVPLVADVGVGDSWAEAH